MQKEIVNEFGRYNSGKSKLNLQSYLGTRNKIYYLKNAQERKIAKDFLGARKDITEKDFLALLDELYTGESINEKTFGTKLLLYKKSFAHLFTSGYVYKWLGALSGWCEVDSLCQSTFTASDLLKDWESWSKMLEKMSKDKNISRRRASLVLLCKSVRGSSDVRLADLAFKNIDRLKGEKDILISKAVSWLLRDLIKHCPGRVKSFLDANEYVLPKFVVKEVTNKLTFGKKTVRKR